MEEYDGTGQLVSIIGKQPDGTHGAVVVSGPVPPRPSRAVVSGGPGLLNYGWDGTFADEATGETDITIPAPMDWGRAEAHASKMQGFTADTAGTLLDTFESPRGGTRTAMLEPGTWFVVLVSRALSGKRSVQSVEVAVEVLEPVGSDIDIEALKDEFRAVDEAMNKAIQENKQAQIDLAGTVGTLKDTTLPALDRDLAEAKTGLDNISGRVGPVEDALDSIQRITLPNLQTAINGKNKTINSVAVPSGTGFTSGDTWQQWSTLETGGRLLAAWRFTTKWDPVLLDPTYLPKVDIGAGTFGSLAGGRLDVGSVTTRELVVGSFTNLVENPSFEYGTASWTGFATGWTVETSGGRRTAPVLRFTGSTTRSLGPQSNRIPLELAGEQVGANSGAKFRVSGWVRTTSTGAARGELCLYVYGGTGSYLGNRNFNIDGATSEWKYFSTIMEAPGANAATASLRVNATLPGAADAYYFDDLSVVSAVEGNLLVENTITSREVNAQSVAAAVGQFVKADIGNLTVTGSSSLNTLTAQRIASNIGQFLSLTTDQLVAGAAQLGEAVARKFAAETGAFMKLYANQLIIGQPGNLIPDPGFNDATMTALRNQHSTCTVSVSSANDLMLTNSATGTTLQYLRPMGTAQTQAGVLANGWVAVKPGEVWSFAFTASAWKGTNGWAQFVGRTADGATNVSVNPRVPVTTTSTEVRVEATIPANCYWIVPEIAVAPGVSYIKRGTLTMQQVITPALVVDGLMNGKRIVGASIETNSAADVGVKLNDNGLVAHGIAKVSPSSGVTIPETKMRAAIDARVTKWSVGTADKWPGLWLETTPPSGAAPAFPPGVTLGDEWGTSALLQSATNGALSPYGEIRVAPDGIQIRSVPNVGGAPDKGLSGLGLSREQFGLDARDNNGATVAGVSNQQSDAKLRIYGKYGVDISSPVSVTINGKTLVAPEDSGWQSASYVNGWRDYGNGFGGLQYRKKDGVLYLRGSIKGGAFYTQVSTLPAGFRPVVPVGTEAMEFPIAVISGSSYIAGTMFAYANGNLTYYAPVSTWTGADRASINASFPL